MFFCLFVFLLVFVLFFCRACIYFWCIFDATVTCEVVFIENEIYMFKLRSVSEYHYVRDHNEVDQTFSEG